MSNIAPEHGPHPIGEIRANPTFGKAGGSRPAKPADPLGTVSPVGPESASGFSVPAADPDNDMDGD